jgi:LacI family transcriptional regulator
VIGCDDVIANTIYPPLTTVTAHCMLAGATAVDLLLDGLADNAPAAQRQVIMGELIVRATTSVAPRRKGAGNRKTPPLQSRPASKPDNRKRA